MKKKSKKSYRIKAGAASRYEIVLRGEARIDAASESKGPRRFSMMAYDGDAFRPMVTPPVAHPVVVDLSALDISKQRFPALKDHDPKLLVGHTDKVTADTKLVAEGVISGVSAAATEVVASADNGFTWGVSMGANFSKMELVPAGKTVQVNGRTIAGPVYVARQGRLRELSFLTLAADDDTAATIAAEAAETTGEVMDFAKWLKANGFLPEDQLTASRLIVLRAQYKASGGKKLDDAAVTSLNATLDAIEEPEQKVESTKVEAKSSNGDALAELKNKLDRLERQNAVMRLCGEKHTEIAATAIEKGWDDDTIKVAIKAAELEAALPHGVQIRTGKAKDAPADSAVLEAACAISGGLQNVEKQFDEKALNEASSRFRHGVSLQELLLSAAWANGYTGYNCRDLREVMQYAFAVKGSGFTSVSLPGILSNTANKFLLEGFMGVEQTWRAISSRRSVNNFNTVTSYRLLDGGQFEEIGPGGEIKHGELSEESFTNKAKTYGRMYAITRQMIINDDLSALSTIPRRLGRQSGLTLNTVFWAAFLDDTSFFADPSQNYLKGATTNLSAAGLTAAEVKFARKVEDPSAATAKQRPLGLVPSVLLVPPDLGVTARTLMQSATFNSGGAATTEQIPNANVFAGRYQVAVSSYLTATKVWYLIASPNDVPVIETAFLNGREQPTIESADADFNTLGIQMRGYFDFGVSKQDARGGLKVKGEA